MAAMESTQPAATAPPRGEWLATHPVPRFCFDLCLAALYGALGRWRERPMRSLRQGRPARVLRMMAPLSQGGVAKVALQTVLATPRDRAETTVLAFGPKQPHPTVLEGRPDIKVRRRRLRLFAGQYQWVTFRHIVELARLIRESRADVVHLHEPQFAPAVAIACALAGRRPLAVHMHNLYGERYKARPIGALQRWVERDALRRRPLIACSRSILGAIEPWLGRTTREVALIEDGVDDVLNAPEDLELSRRLREAAGDRPVIVKMTRLAAHKRVDDFLLGCRRLLDGGTRAFVLLCAYGKEEDEREQRRRFDALFRPDEALFFYHVLAPQHLLRYCAVGVTASELEGLGLNVLEFQAAGLPVVCSDIPPHHEMVEDGATGLMFPVGDVDGLAARVRRLLEDPALAARLGEAGRVAASRRTWRRTGEQTVEFYRRAFAPPGAPIARGDTQ